MGIRKKTSSGFTVEQKYQLYEASVQCPENDISFINEKFKELRGRKPLTLREDFCGTGYISCEWVQQSPKHEAWGLDLDPEPVNYGKNTHYVKLSKSQQRRMHYDLKNVMKPVGFKADVCAAFNFSYYIFKKRQELVEYFKMARKGLTKDGIFIIDLFGGPDSQTVMEEETEHDTHSYYWDCDKYNPLTNECLFRIHFKPKGQKKKVKNVFTYDWRMWTVPELRDIMTDAGFSKTFTYWEGEDEDGDGDGIFIETQDAENCDSWVTYIIAVA